MGQAKQRGTFEQRKTRATRSQIEDAAAEGLIKHYAFVIDRSEIGREALNALRTGPEEMQARVKHPAVDLWEASGFKFLVIWGSFGYTGGLTLCALDYDELVDISLPAVIERIHEKNDGLCSFAFAVTPDLAQALHDKVAELQAALGDGIVEVEHASHDPAGMLDLATAATGREVNMDFVQILDQKAFGEVSNAMMHVAGMVLSQGKSMDSTDLKLFGRVQDDGRLTVECDFPGFKRFIEIPKGQWRELTPSMYRDLVDGLQADAVQEDYNELLGSLAEHISSVNAVQKQHSANMNHLMDGVEQGIILFDRSANSLAALKNLVDQKDYIRTSADRWLASEDTIFVLSMGSSAPAHWASSAKVMESQIDELIAEVIEHCITPSATVLTCTFGTAEFRRHLNIAWRDLGGKAIA